MGRHDEARVLEEQALEIRQRILPKDHPRIASSMTNLAVTYDALGEHEKALEMEEEVRVLRLGVCFRGRRRRRTRSSTGSTCTTVEGWDLVAGTRIGDIRRPQAEQVAVTSVAEFLVRVSVGVRDERACVYAVCVCVCAKGA